MISLLNEVVSSWGGFIDSMTGLSTVLWVVLAIVGAIGSIYAIYLGVQLSRADEQGKRDDAKKHLITTVIAVGVTVVLILFFNIFLPMILSAFQVGQSGGRGDDYEQTDPEGGGGMITLFQNFAGMVKCKLM